MSKRRNVKNQKKNNLKLTISNSFHIESTYLEQLFETVQEGIAFADQNSIIHSVNSEFLRMFGYELDEVIGHPIDDLIVPEHRRDEADSLTSAVVSGKKISIQTVRKKKNNDLIHVSILASPILSPEGQQGVYGIYRNITDQILTQMELRREKAYTDQLFEGAGEAIVLVDNEGRIRRANREFVKLFGYSLDELLGMVVDELIAPDDLKDEASELTKKVLSGNLVSVETIRRNKDGEQIDVSILGSPVWIDGQQNSVYAIYRDITARKRVQIALKESTRFLTALLKDLPGMAYRCKNDQYRSMEFVSEGAQKLTGYSAEDLSESGKHSYHDVIHKDDRKKVLQEIKKSIEKNEGYHEVYRLITADGNQKWVLEQGQGVYSEAGENLAMEGLIIDLTELKRAEDALENAKRRIEKLHEISMQLQVCKDEQETFNITVSTLEGILDFDICSLIIFEDGKLVKKAISSGLPDNQDTDIRECLAEKTFKNQKTYVFQSREDAPEPSEINEETQSGISAPIGEFGVFQVTSRENDAFTESDVKVLELLLGYTTQTIRRLRLQQNLIDQATHDPLTGLFNRNYFSQILDLEKKRSERYKCPIGFLMIDVDNFKNVNDTYGHQVGDRVLSSVAATLLEALRKSDIAIRYGGDEFLVILTETADEINLIEERVKEKIRNNKVLAGITGHTITISVGSAHWSPDGKKSISDVLSEADKKMYKDKNNNL